MSKIDFSEAPKGATHHVSGRAPNWYKVGHGLIEYWNSLGSEWVASGARDLERAYGRCCTITPIPDIDQLVSVEDVQPATGSKHYSGKPLMGAVPPAALLAVARVLTFGAQKYGRDNWRLVENADVRYLDAALRHLNAHQRGETVDPESGESHLAHAVCSLMFMLETQEGE